MKDAINYFIPIVKDPMNAFTGRCMTTNSVLDSSYCGSYHPAKAHNQPVCGPHAPYPNVHMETNSMDIEYNNLIEIDDCQDQQSPPPPTTTAATTRKRLSYGCDGDGRNAKRCRREDAEPSICLATEQSAMALPKIQTHQRQPTHNMPDMPRCMMGHYV